MPGAADGETAFQHGGGLRQVALAEGQKADAIMGNHKAVRVFDGLSDLHRLCAQRVPFSKSAYLRKTHHQIDPGPHCSNAWQAEMLIALLASQAHHIFLEDFSCLMKVPQIVVDRPQPSPGHHLETSLAEGRGKR